MMRVGTRRWAACVAALSIAAGAAGGCAGTDTARVETRPLKAASGPGKVHLRVAPQGVVDHALEADDVELDAPGYVAVYRDGGGAPGEQIGSSRLLPAGRHRKVAVRLSAKGTPTATVWLMLHHEDNGNDTLDFPAADQPVTGDTGVIVVAIPVASTKGSLHDD